MSTALFFFFAAPALLLALATRRPARVAARPHGGDPVADPLRLR
ncbi:hypothetical protein [Neoroseomonas soli]|nr:hypothetical protein [Neoroseomonas soli]